VRNRSKTACQGAPDPDITLAADGERALFLLMEEHINPDLIILDLCIPKVSGISVLKQYHPKEQPPVVVFSSTWGQIDIREALALGARAVVHKPIDVQSFMDAVCGMVRKWVPLAAATS
jgi:DNA-binding response OmpR family regulator